MTGHGVSGKEIKMALGYSARERFSNPEIRKEMEVIMAERGPNGKFIKKEKQVMTEEKTELVFEVVKDVEIPGKNHNGNGKYPFATMEVGDCFTFPVAMVKTITQAAKAYTKKMDGKVKFTVRTKTPDDDHGRIWRVKVEEN